MPDTAIAIAPESSTIADNSFAVSIVDSGTGTNPPRIAPRNHITNAGSSLTTIATRSPATSPSDANACCAD